MRQSYAIRKTKSGYDPEYTTDFETKNKAQNALDAITREIGTAYKIVYVNAYTSTIQDKDGNFVNTSVVEILEPLNR